MVFDSRGCRYNGLQSSRDCSVVKETFGAFAMSQEKPRADIESLRRMLRKIERKAAEDPPVAPPPVPLEEAVSGEVVETARGALYLVEKDASAFLDPEDDFRDVARLFFAGGRTNRARLQSLDPELARIADLPPERVLFLDIETAGFHGTGLFLVGLMSYCDGAFRTSQLFARDYAEEAAVLEHLREFYGRSDALVTFNGRAFDLPFISDRAIVHRVDLHSPEIDVDLLHVSRRLWKNCLPNCRLVTLEETVCGRRRTGDLPSHLIPRAYHDFVESGDARLMADVIRHNAYDLVTMVHLVARIANG